MPRYKLPRKQPRSCVLFLHLTPVSLSACSFSFLPLSFPLLVYLPGVVHFKNSFNLTVETLPCGPQFPTASFQSGAFGPWPRFPASVLSSILMFNPQKAHRVHRLIYWEQIIEVHFWASSLMLALHVDRGFVWVLKLIG